MIEALAAQRGGFSIFPVEPGEKTPIRIYQERSKEDAPWTVRWSEIATNELPTIARWWAYAPTANIGVACKPSGLLVVDCDQPKRDGLLTGTPWEGLHELFGPLVDGETLFDAVAQRYAGVNGVREAFDTYSVATGSGGLHLYYRWPEGVQSTQDSIVKGVLDVRGNGGERGGYVLAAGSQTSSGAYVVRNRAPIRDAPAWLVELCRDRPRTRPASPPSAFNKPKGPAYYEGLIRTVRTAPDGNLNNSLLWAARSMCEDGLPQDDAEEMLAPVYADCGGRGGERQARATIRSAYRLQSRKM